MTTPLDADAFQNPKAAPARGASYLFPTALTAVTRFERLAVDGGDERGGERDGQGGGGGGGGGGGTGNGGVPALLAHPDWSRPAATVIWLHGRTVSKELDNGRYLRWVRAGLAAVALDLPGHGERIDAAMQEPGRTLEVVAQAVGEIDGVVRALGDARFGGAFDLSRMAIGGMSAGGMVTLRRLCDKHAFKCAAVEGTAGDLGAMYLDEHEPSRAKWAEHDVRLVHELSAIEHLGGFAPVPVLAVHSRADKVVPVACIERFTDALRARYVRLGAGDVPVTLHTWASTGAADEHSGFGRVSAEAKTLQVEFLLRHLG